MSGGAGDSANDQSAGGAVPLWGRWERAFEAAAPAAETETETELSVELTSPSGRRRVVDGFWDGGATWRVRFMPDEVGRWGWRTRSTPGVPGLSGEVGAFVAEAGAEPGAEAGAGSAASRGPFARHGPLRVGASGRYFEHADGTPFFWLGDTAWYGPALSEPDDWDTFLADRVAKRFSVVHFNVVAPRNGLPADAAGEVSFTGHDRIAINPRFYQRLDARVDAVNARGLLAGVVLLWALREVDSGTSLPEAEAARLMRYLVARYGAHHVAWILAGDTAYEGETAARWKRLGRAVFGDRPHAPTTLHPVTMHWPWEAFRDEAWFDFLIYQSGHGDDAEALRWLHSGPPHDNWDRSPVRPVINLEPPYEDHLGYQSRQPHTPYVVRRSVYWSLLSTPPAGVTYGAHGLWSWHTADGEPPTDHPTTGVAKTWREAMDLSGSSQMAHVAALFTSLPWWTLRPDDALLAAQPGGDDPARHVAAARSDDGTVAVLYLPVGGAVVLAESVGEGAPTACWFDPRSGEERPAAGEAAGCFRAPDGQDWVLVLRRQ